MKQFYMIMDYLISVAEVFGFMLIIATYSYKGKINDIKYKYVLGSVFISIIVIICNSIETITPYTTLFAILITMTYSIVAYKAKVTVAVISTCIGFGITVILDLIVTLSLCGIGTFEEIAQMGLFRIMIGVLSKTLTMIIAFVIYKKKREHIEEEKKIFAILALYGILLIVECYCFYLIGVNFKDEHVSANVAIVFLISLVLQLGTFVFAYNYIKTKDAQKKAKFIEMRNDVLQHSLEDTIHTFNMWRTSVHDYKNDIIMLAGMVKEGNYDKVEEFINERNNTISRMNYYIKTGNIAVDTIVNAKQNIAEEKGITFYVNASVPENCVISDLDFANIIGNLIDNAISAAEKEENPLIDIIIKLQKNMLIIKITNSCNNKIDEKLETTKEDKIHHGIGIISIKSITEKYNGDVTFVAEEGKFVATVMIPNYEK